MPWPTPDESQRGIDLRRHEPVGFGSRANVSMSGEVVAAVERLRASGGAVTVGAIQAELRSLNYQAGKQGVEASVSRLGIDVSNPDGASRAQKALKSLRQSGRY